MVVPCAGTTKQTADNGNGLLVCASYLPSPFRYTKSHASRCVVPPFHTTPSTHLSTLKLILRIVFCPFTFISSPFDYDEETNYVNIFWLGQKVKGMNSVAPVKILRLWKAQC
ncbi:hypothetical protein GmHk_01G001478 [Glycine max]|nr:hypothetical protein GmHk_01G001478 [Glycine max]